MGWRLYCFLAACFWSNLLAAYPTPFDVDGALHRWPISTDGPRVYYEVVAADDNLETYLEGVTEESAAIWSAVDGSILKLSAYDDEHAPQITIFFDRSIAGGDTAAGYSIFDKVEQGVPEHCSIRIAVNAAVDPESLGKTTLHELGHCIGLGHSLMPESIMSYNLEKNSFGLSIDDMAALSRIYPNDGGQPKLAPGCSISGGGSPSTSSNPLIFIGLILFPLFLSSIRLAVRKHPRF